jgi:hypothetical protein
MNDDIIDRFVTDYIEAIFFTDTGEEGQPPPDAELAEVTLTECLADCSRFLAKAKPLIDQTSRTYTKAAHDFWFTRNGHGVGFWDGDWPEPQAAELSALAESFGQVDLYQGDDGLLYLA